MKHERFVMDQATNFWQSPWALSGGWENPEGLKASYYLEPDRLSVEIRGAQNVVAAKAQATELFLQQPSGVQVRIPLPTPVEGIVGEELQGEPIRIQLRRQVHRPVTHDLD